MSETKQFCDGCNRRCELGAVGYNLFDNGQTYYLPTIDGRVITRYVGDFGILHEVYPVTARSKYYISVCSKSDAQMRATGLSQEIAQRCDRHKDCRNGCSWIPELHGAPKEILTADKMKKMFGEKYQHMAWYNADVFMKNSGADIFILVDRYKSAVENLTKRLPDNYRVVALVVTAIDYDDTVANHSDVVKNPPAYKKPAYPSERSIKYLGTAVVRDVNTGKILPPTNNYIVSHVDYLRSNLRLVKGLEEFALFLDYNDDFCQKMADALTVKQSFWQRLRQKLK